MVTEHVTIAPEIRDSALGNESEVNRKVCSVTVTFHPSQYDIANLTSMRGQVQGAVVVDNGSNETELATLREVCGNLQVHLIENGANLGIAAALNKGVQWAQTQGCSWVILFDQDSAAPNGLVGTLLSAVMRDPQPEKIGIMAPLCEDARNRKVSSGMIRLTGRLTLAQTSGSLMPISVFEKVGWFDEKLFIDTVDWEYGMRLLSAGWLVKECKSALLRHNHGSPTPYKFLGIRLFLVRNYAPVRRYYQARNAFWLFRQHGRKQFLLCTYILCGLAKNIVKILAEKNRLQKFDAAFAGCVDGVFGKMGNEVQTYQQAAMAPEKSVLKR